jgi:hypothetical protein
VDATVLWKNDIGTDGSSAVDLLIDIICGPEWYDGWKVSKGVDRDNRAKRISESLVASGCSLRPVSSITSKIQELFRKFREFKDNSTQTGSGTHDGSRWQSETHCKDTTNLLDTGCHENSSEHTTISHHHRTGISDRGATSFNMDSRTLSSSFT